MVGNPLVSGAYAWALSGFNPGSQRKQLGQECIPNHLSLVVGGKKRELSHQGQGSNSGGKQKDLKSQEPCGTREKSRSNWAARPGNHRLKPCARMGVFPPRPSVYDAESGGLLAESHAFEPSHADSRRGGEERKIAQWIDRENGHVSTVGRGVNDA
jgi:hypothetical protein